MFFNSYLITKHQKRDLFDSFYQKIVDVSRNKVFYTKLNIPDTLDGRYDLLALFSIILMLIVIQTSMRGPKRGSDDDIDDDDWMSEFIGTTQDVDMDAITQTVPKDVPQIEEEEEEDPFAVNLPSRKSRRRKAPEVVEEEDEDEAFFGLDDEDDEEEEEEKPKKRKVGRRLAPKNAPRRRQVGRRKKTED